MQTLIDQMTMTFGEYAVNIGVAVLILIVGWLVALLISALVRKGLERVSFDNRIAEGMGFDRSKINLEAAIGKIVFYLLMLLVAVAIFETLRLTLVTGPLNALLQSVFAYLPNLLAAIGLMLLAWILASGLRFIVAKVLGATKLDDRLASQVGVSREGQPPLSETLASIVYWFVLLLFVPAVVGALNIQGLLLPVQSMIVIILNYLPNFLASALILVVGWLVARIIRQIMTNFLAAVGTDRLGERVGLTVGYDQDLGRVRTVLVDLLNPDPRILASPPYEIVVLELGDNGVRLEVHAMVSPDDYWSVLSDLRERIKTRFDAEKIAFALPQRDVRLTAIGVTDRNGAFVP